VRWYLIAGPCCGVRGATAADARRHLRWSVLELLATTAGAFYWAVGGDGHRAVRAVSALEARIYVALHVFLILGVAALVDGAHAVQNAPDPAGGLPPSGRRPTREFATSVSLLLVHPPALRRAVRGRGIVWLSVISGRW
jgi:hypothetical protein